MRSTSLRLLLAAVVALTIGWTAFGGDGATATEDEILSGSGFGWEYQTIQGDLSEETLNTAGGEGWELVTVTDTTLGVDTAIFKRPAQQVP